MSGMCKFKYIFYGLCFLAVIFLEGCAMKNTDAPISCASAISDTATQNIDQGEWTQSSTVSATHNPSDADEPSSLLPAIIENTSDNSITTSGKTEDPCSGSSSNPQEITESRAQLVSDSEVFR